MTEHELFMKAALDEAQLAFQKNEVPIGAVVVKDGIIIASAHNLRNTNKNTLDHAELIAIAKACEVLQDWRLENCDMYVNVEPCPMCAGAIVQARMKRLIYATENPKAGACGSLMNVLQQSDLNHQVEFISGVMKEESKRLVQQFFIQLRKKA